MNHLLNLIEKYREKGVRLTLDSTRSNLSIKGNLSSLTVEDKIELKEAKEGLVEMIKAQKEGHVQIPKTNVEIGTNIPLSPNQKSIWVQCQIENDPRLYTIPAIYSFDLIDFEEVVFKESVRILVKEHQAMSYVFCTVDGEPFQRITEVNIEEHLHFLNVEGENDDDKSHWFENTVSAYIQKGLTIHEKSPWQIYVFDWGNGNYRFFLFAHHLIADGASLQIMIEETFKIYKCCKDHVEYKNNAIQYHDYIHWLKESDYFNSSKAFWKAYLKNYTDEAQMFVIDQPSENDLSSDFEVELNPNLLKRTETFCQKEKIGKTQFFTFTFGLLIAKYSRVQDLVIGTPSESRTHHQLSRIIGDLVNVIPVRLKINYEESVLQQLKQFSSDYIQLLEHQTYPFERILEDIGFKRENNKSPLLNALISFPNNQSHGEKKEEQGISSNNTSLYSLTCSVIDYSNQTNLVFEYDHDQFSELFIRGLSKSFSTLIDSLLESTESKLGDVSMMSHEDKEWFNSVYSNKSSAFSCDQNTLQIISNCRDKTPDFKAVIVGGESFTYADLWSQSNSIFEKLRASGIEKGDRVITQLSPSVDLIATVLSIWRLGAVYVPLPINIPELRKAEVKQICSSKLIITETFFKNLLPCESFVENQSISLSDSAYIIFTSGSTGKPKGVTISHGALANKLKEEEQLLSLINPIVSYTLTSPAFDVSFLEMLLPLTAGGTVVVSTKTNLFHETVNEIIEFGVNVLQGTPTYFNHFIKEIDDHQANSLNKELKLFCIGGESLNDTLVRSLKSRLPDVQINNHYGPTEITIDAIVKENISTFSKNIIGAPIGNTEFFILDESGNELPAGIVGELFIGGPSLAQGYFGDPEVTAQKFQMHKQINKKVYATGDLAACLENGEVAFVGRKDQQVKYRGYRIELEEINAKLREDKSISDAYTLVHGHALVSWVVAEEGSESEFRNSLMNSLPDYMIPTKILLVDHLPMNRNGKIDEKQLPFPSTLDQSEAEPISEMEEQLITVWRKVLGHDKVEMYDNFFDLGGNSLALIKLQSAYEKQFNIRIELKSLFSALTPAAHSQLISNSQSKDFEEIALIRIAENYPLSEGQNRLWVLSQFKEVSVAYNMAYGVELVGEYDLDKIKQAIEDTIDRHESLRTVFRPNDSGEIRQWIFSKEDLSSTFEYIDFRSENEDSKKLNKLIESRMRLEFNLANGPLFKVYIIQLTANKYYFFSTMHHIISDGWSMEVLFEDITKAYESIVKGTPKKPALRIQYKDFVGWQNNYSGSDKFQVDKAFWSEQLFGELPKINFPSSKVRPIQKTNNGYQIGLFVQPETLALVKGFGRKNGGSVFSTLLAGLKVVLSIYTKQDDIIVGLPVAGRNHSELTDQIGFYLNTLPIRSLLNIDETFFDFYKKLVRTTVESYEHQSYPFDRLVEDLSLKRDTSRGLVFDVMVMHLAENGYLPNEVKNSKIEKGIIDLGRTSTKFDLEFVFHERGEELCCILNYNPDVHDREIMEGLLRNYELLIKQLCENQDSKLSEIVRSIEIIDLDEFRNENITQSIEQRAVIYESPRSKLDEEVQEIWKDTLDGEIDGIQTDFFTVGGNSLKMMRLIAEYRKTFNVRIDFKELFNNTALKEHADLISDAKQDDFISIPKVRQADSYPLSDGQRRLWLLSQFEDVSVAYNMAAEIELKGDYNSEFLLNAITATVQRHEILRTRFKLDSSGEIRQWITPENEKVEGIFFHDLRNKSVNAEEFRSHLSVLSDTHFNLVSGPLFGVHLFQLENDRYVLHYTLHHIISDGWSMNVLYKDVLDFYESFMSSNDTVAKVPLAFQYKDVVAWQKSLLNDASFKEDEQYWLNRFSGDLPQLNLPSSLIRPNTKTSNGHQLGRYLARNQVAGLRKLSNESGSSIFNNLLMILKVLFYRYSHQSDLILGIPVAGRDHADLSDQIGFYVNTLVIRSQVDPKETLSSYAERVKNIVLDAYSHQLYPFDLLIESLNLEREPSRSWVFDIMVSHLEKNEHLLTAISENDISRTIDFGSTRTKFDMEVIFQEVDDTVCIIMNFNPDVYQASMIEQLLGHYETLLINYLASPNQEVESINLLTEHEHNELLTDFNSSSVPMNTELTIVDEFNNAIDEYGNEIALVFGDQKLSFHELDQLSNEFASYLNNYPSSSKRVGVLLDRSEWLAVVLLGILKSGSAYVPMSVNYPLDRIEFIKEDSGLDTIVDSTFLEDFKNRRSDFEGLKLTSTGTGKDAAYVIYTSGSTGKPKGVSISHSNLLNFLTNYKLSKSRSSLTCSYVFDVSVMEIFATLLSGSTLVIPEESVTFSPTAYADFLFENKITHCYLHPMHLMDISKRLNEHATVYLERILIGVEAIKPSAIAWYAENGVRIVNGYGPTENTICTTFYEFDSIENIITKNVPIGRPLANCQVYLLEEYSTTLVPKGVVGELCIGGEGLSEGYVNRKELTDQYFVNNPFETTSKMYRTGDLARWLPDGNIEFIGRKDNQVKINGHRIELGEIEHVLQSHQDVHETIVLAKKLSDDADYEELVAYVIGTPNMKIKELRAHLSQELPNYMVPSYFVFLEEFPLTLNGKLDRKALPNPLNSELQTGEEYVSPKTSSEKRLVEIWEKVLKRKKIGRRDQFFSLGGDSLKVIKLMHGIALEFNVQLSFALMFEYSTLSDQAELISNTEKNEVSTIKKVEKAIDYPTSRSQKRIWLASLKRDGSIAHNMPVTILIKGKLNYENLENSLLKVIQRHEVLRTAVRMNEENDLRQFPMELEELSFKIDRKDVREFGYDLFASEIHGLIDENSQTYFSIEQGQVLKVLAIHISDEVYLINVVMHHIAGDEWSFQIFFNELMTYYRELNSNGTFELEPLDVQYKDITNWEERNFSLAEDMTTFWKSEFVRPLIPLDLPKDFEREFYNQEGARSSLKITDELNAKLTELKKATDSTNSMIFAALLSVLLHKIAGSRDFAFALITAKRNAPLLQNQMGPYLNILPIRFEIDPSDTLLDQLDQSKKRLLEVMKNGDQPFEEIIKHIHPRESRAIQVGLNVLNNIEASPVSLSEPGLDISYFDNGFRSSKFPLCFYVYETEGQFEVQLEYQTQMFTEKTVAKMLDHLVKVVDDFSESPEKLISAVQLEKSTVLPKIGRIRRGNNSLTKTR